MDLDLSAGFDYDGPEAIWEEMRQVTPAFYGIDYARIEREGGVHWPCPSFDHPGTPYLFADEFPRGKGKFWEVSYGTESEQPDEAYPYNLSTGRVRGLGAPNWKMSTPKPPARCILPMRPIWNYKLATG